MGFLDRFFGRSSNSADTAKTRLVSALAHDRSDITPQTLDTVRDEIVSVVSRHLEIDRENVQVTVSRTADVHQVVASLPVIRMRPTRSKPLPRRSTRAVRTK